MILNLINILEMLSMLLRERSVAREMILATSWGPLAYGSIKLVRAIH